MSGDVAALGGQNILGEPPRVVMSEQVECALLSVKITGGTGVSRATHQNLKCSLAQAMNIEGITSVAKTKDCLVFKLIANPRCIAGAIEKVVAFQQGISHDIPTKVHIGLLGHQLVFTPKFQKGLVYKIKSVVPHLIKGRVWPLRLPRGLGVVPVNSMLDINELVEPGKLLMTEDIFQLVGNFFNAKRVGNKKIEGIVDIIEVYEAALSIEDFENKGVWPRDATTGIPSIAELPSGPLNVMQGDASLVSPNERPDELLPPVLPHVTLVLDADSPDSGGAGATLGAAADMQPMQNRTRPHGGRVQSSLPPTKPPQRFLQGRMPQQVKSGDRVALQIRVSLQPGNGPSVELKQLPLECDIRIVVHCPGFELRSPNIQSLHVPAREDSEWRFFELEAKQPGVHSIEVTAFHGGTYIGVLTLEVIVAREVTTSRQMDLLAAVSHRTRQPGEMSLIIHFSEAQNVYRYQLIDDSVGCPDETQSEPLKRTPQEAIEDLVTQLNEVARGGVPYNAEQTRRWLKGKGIELWDEFIPKSLQQQFWERQNKIARMMILTSGDPVPWELLYPFESDGNRDAGFLAEQFPVARWMIGGPPPSELNLSSAAFVLPDDSLESAKAETNTLRQLVESNGILTDVAISDIDRLIQLLDNADFDLLHFACHNTFKPKSPASSGIMMGEVPFQLSLLTGLPKQFHFPLVFMNSCRSDGQAPIYTRHTGWAIRFLAAGAGAFVGTLWEVRDQSAHIFAKEFYKAILADQNLGDSLKAARNAIKDEPGDPTWLAYTLYGDPAAKVKKGEYFG